MPGLDRNQALAVGPVRPERDEVNLRQRDDDVSSARLDDRAAATARQAAVSDAKGDHSLTLGNATVAEDDLSPSLDAASGNDREQRIFLRADKQVDYGALMELMNKRRGTGSLKVALFGREASETR